jgi:hypothetical protein
MMRGQIRDVGGGLDRIALFVRHAWMPPGSVG